MNLFKCSFVVLDEADRMFDLGFEGQISNILTNIRSNKQIVMFSETFPKSIENIAKKILNNNYIEIVIENRSSVNENITQEIIIEKKKFFIKIMWEFQKNFLNNLLIINNSNLNKNNYYHYLNNF